MSTSHPLFVQYPLHGEVDISTGRVPVPYQTYDGHGTLVGGTADLAAVRDLLQAESVHPMVTADGRAVFGLWLVDFTAASLGPHLELQVSFLVSHRPAPPVAAHPLTLLKSLATNPAARMFCHGLWNSTEAVVAYNRELLGLNAQLCQGAITRAQGEKQIRLTDAAGARLVEGRLHEAPRPSPRIGWTLMRLLGPGAALRLLRQPYLGAKVVNPIGSVLPYNADAQTFVAADTPVVQLFDPAVDALALEGAAPPALDLQPDFVEHFAPFRFVYLMPEKPTP